MVSIITSEAFTLLMLLNALLLLSLLIARDILVHLQSTPAPRPSDTTPNAETAARWLRLLRLVFLPTACIFIINMALRMVAILFL